MEDLRISALKTLPLQSTSFYWALASRLRVSRAVSPAVEIGKAYALAARARRKMDLKLNNILKMVIVKR